MSEPKEPIDTALSHSTIIFTEEPQVWVHSHLSQPFDYGRQENDMKQLHLRKIGLECKDERNSRKWEQNLRALRPVAGRPDTEGAVKEGHAQESCEKVQEFMIQKRREHQVQFMTR